MLVGVLAALSFCIGLFGRMVFGGHGIIGRAFVFSGDVAICRFSPLLYRWIDAKKQNPFQGLRRSGRCGDQTSTNTIEQ